MSRGIQTSPRLLRLTNRLAVVGVVLLACGDSSTSVGPLTITIEPAAGLVVGVGGTYDFLAVVTDDLGEPVFGQDVSWSVASTQIATIDQDGLATGVAAGVTTVTASAGGASGTAQLEVYVPETLTRFEPGTSYFGRNDYVEYIPGDLPLVLSAPHGGQLEPLEILNRTYGTLVSDRNTIELTLAVRDAFIEQTGSAPHVIISHLHRLKLDPNREIVEAAQGNPFAERAWDEFQSWIRAARANVGGDFGGGMYFDMHGHGHPTPRLELGYLIGPSVLNQADQALNSIDIVRATSIRELGRLRPGTFAELIRGDMSLGGLLEAEGVPAVPSPAAPSPGVEPYFSGGYNTRQHGSMADSEIISGIQLEHHFPGLRDTDQHRRAYAAQLANAVRAYMLEHFGFFEPA